MKMLRFIVNFNGRCCVSQKRTFSQTKKLFTDKNIRDEIIKQGKDSNPTLLKKLKNNLESMKGSLKLQDTEEIMINWMGRPPEIPRECDIVIIGGGAMGSAIAYWLKKKLYSDSFKVVVVERDPSYTTASTALAVGGLRQQFSLKENIQMSLFGAEFLRNINEYLSVPGQPAIDPYFHPYGYLILASDEGAERLTENSKLQNFLGAKNILLSGPKLKSIFPWLNTEGVALGCLGLEKEGWFDPWTLLCAFKRKAMSLGIEYVTAEAQEFKYKEVAGGFQKMEELVVKTKDGETHSIGFSMAVLAAGPFSGEIAKRAKLGVEKGMREKCLPVEPRKRYIFCVHCPDGPGLNTPLTIDHSGAYFRREGLAGAYLCGKSPEESEEPSVDNLDVDYDYFNEKVWPLLAHRIPAFEKLKLKASWAGYYEYNTFDQNGIIGPHPYYRNLLFATGFSGHGIQQAPAVGRAIAELIVDGKYMTIDLSKLGFQRIIDGVPTPEINII